MSEVDTRKNSRRLNVVSIVAGILTLVCCLIGPLISASYATSVAELSPIIIPTLGLFGLCGPGYAWAANREAKK